MADEPPRPGRSKQQRPTSSENGARAKSFPATPLTLKGRAARILAAAAPFKYIHCGFAPAASRAASRRRLKRPPRLPITV